jgi:hypothetical protein
MIVNSEFSSKIGSLTGNILSNFADLKLCILLLMKSFFDNVSLSFFRFEDQYV